ncbi:MAG: HK97 gp10 family phage protein [Alphaproteobacteria bacterium]|nr:HK97 gp10 family phage protein [Alphaproteobacteria bacterium]MBU1770653.1 HK97 gp10 family phage protein [Alphaproteobacteria bacterium]
MLASDKQSVAWQKKTLRAGSTIVLKAAKRNVPVRTGALKRSLDRKFHRGGEYVVIGPRRDFVAHAAGDKYIFLKGKEAREFRKAGLKGNIRPVKYAGLVEHGTAAHQIANWLGRRGVAVAHPGARPKPFLRPAFDENVRATLDAIGKKMWEGIASSAKKSLGV